MTEKGTEIRKRRADAERNRQLLLEAARKRFAASGVGASLEEIARDAGVGIGTLYRHFPTRNALIVEVYRQSLDELAAAATALAASDPPVQALREWLLLFVDFLASKRILADTLASLAAASPDVYPEATPRLQSAMELLVGRATESGEIAPGFDPLDLLRAISGIAYFDAAAGWEDRAKTLVDVLIAGLRNT